MAREYPQGARGYPGSLTFGSSSPSILSRVFQFCKYNAFGTKLNRLYPILLQGVWQWFQMRKEIGEFKRTNNIDAMECFSRMLCGPNEVVAK